MARGVEDRIAALYGDAVLPCDAGVVHVAAVWAAADDRYVVLRIGPHSPKSAADAFALALSRARADAILTTGAILRAEPTMTVAHAGPLAAPLLRWRAEVLGRSRAPALVVLTRGDLDLGHPALHGDSPAWIVTGAQGAARLRPTLAGSGVHLVELSVPGASAAIAWARRSLGARTVSVEAGPTAALPLYRGDAPLVDELLLSVVRDRPLPAACGGPFLSPAEVRALMGQCLADTVVDEPSGQWRVQRWVRR